MVTTNRENDLKNDKKNPMLSKKIGIFDTDSESDGDDIIAKKSPCKNNETNALIKTENILPPSSSLYIAPHLRKSKIITSESSVNVPLSSGQLLSNSLFYFYLSQNFG